MSHQIEWYLEGQVIRAIVWGFITIDEIREANAKLIEMLSSVHEQRVHLLCESDQLSGFSVGLPSLYREINYVRHRNLGWTVIINPKTSHIVKHITTTFSKLTGLRLIRASGQTEAFEQLCSLNPSLRDSIKIANS